jgi:hypothetical protein
MPNGHQFVINPTEKMTNGRPFVDNPTGGTTMQSEKV